MVSLQQKLVILDFENKPFFLIVALQTLIAAFCNSHLQQPMSANILFGHTAQKNIHIYINLKIRLEHLAGRVLDNKVRAIYLLKAKHKIILKPRQPVSPVRLFRWCCKNIIKKTIKMLKTEYTVVTR